MINALRKLLDPGERLLKKFFSTADYIESLEQQTSTLTDEELKNKTKEFKEAYNNGTSLDDLLPEAFAVVREASKRTLGLRHFRVQLVGGMVLNHGDIAEMKTGEGKTLVATLPAYLNALSGNGVHIITVNDYLAKRDREWMGNLFEFLGLSVGLNLANMTFEEKRDAYKSDITFGTNNEFGFDYLRDNMVLYNDQLTQRLNYAIIDEVDSILIDEARTPLIISGQANQATDIYNTADKVVRYLKSTEDFVIDIKTKQVSLTEVGTKKVEKSLGIDNLYDMKNLTLNHHIQQALKAHTLMKRDEDYVVNEDGVVIVDEFTGRLMYGRRFSDGLHQAIEAKEKLPVQRESMTLATVTLQNYFRLYNKLSGMTGTAKTEEEEFRKIYNMDVIQVPTNKPTCRQDLSDILYRSEEAKFKSVVNEIEEKHQKGQPVLVGTVSIEKSEKISRMLKKRGIKHEVLNAKNHAREAEIITRAGQMGAVTIATNMAGRGTDIVLGEGVSEVGGLHVIGTERHESRRIDNQLRGRSGRQGDPGSSQFFLSFSDDLLKRFGANNMESMMERLGLEEDQPIEGRMFTKAVSNAQKKVEGNNFDVRRHVLQYDDVLNQQREIIYKQRKEVLSSEDLKATVLDMAKGYITSLVTAHTVDGDIEEQRDIESILEAVDSNLLPVGTLSFEDFKRLTPEEITETIVDEVNRYYESKLDDYGKERFHEFTKIVLLRSVDRKWLDHIDAMEQLRQGIHLRAYGQENPLRAYQFEGFAMFEQMVEDIQQEVIKYLFKSVIQDETNLEPEEIAVDTVFSTGENAPKEQKKVVPIRSSKVGRNQPCPCGSGNKYKNCCFN